MPAAATLLVVDGHAGVRHALAVRLRRAPHIETVHTAGTLPEALALARAHAPHLAICDPRSLGGDTLDAVRQIRREVAHVLVLATTLHEREQEALLRAGAAAVLLKGDTHRLLGEIAALATP
jgi:DNA-binding NarL/FixJ family response regulator